jgi:glycogen operon protein
LARCIGICLNGQAGGDRNPHGTSLEDDVFLVLMNAHHDTVPFVLPSLANIGGWHRVLDTGDPEFAGNGTSPPGQVYDLPGRVLVVLLATRGGDTGFQDTSETARA